MVAKENQDLTNDKQDKKVRVNSSSKDKNLGKENIDDEEKVAETLVAEGLNGSSEDLEDQMATQMAANGLASDKEDDLEAQMTAAMSEESNVSIENEDDLQAKMAAAMGEGLGGDENLFDALSGEDQDSATPVKKVSFQQLVPSDEAVDKVNIDRLVDVSLSLSVELGRKNMRIKEILGLGPGKIIELDKLAGEPVDLLVNGKLLAKGEVVVVDENFGVRITELINPLDRIKMFK